ncbi:UvrD-helicase domain-containing protein [Roseateles violae]|uniref:DNA 3'-5' helicase n=1 Tax=Roseateles violae TaxID=3058042 RepID=A0ABT8DPW9_9BURK|nr:UvrD-helicase domain-containing protein [Pelomonas sp. PFR6]MDN3920397.1 UvrD-helicase domain-containing protein [Pelomonas sp. PFR6]
MTAMNPMNAAAYTVDGRLAEREDFYRVACDPARSVVVEACAGAGKTWMLVSRILRALLAGARPQEIVAITFTRKAAGEMRQRLNEWLDQFAAATPDERQRELVARGMSADQARAAEAVLAGLRRQLLLAGRGVEIRTFHAWFSQLLRAAPLELLQAQGIAPELQLIEDEADLMPELMSRFHAAVLADAQLREDYQALVLARGRNTVRDWLQAGFDKRVELRLAQREGLLLDGMPEAASVMPECAGLAHPLEHFCSLRAELLALARLLGQAKGAKAQEAACAIEQGIDDFAAVIKALFTDKGTPRKGLGELPELAALCDRLERLARACAQHEAWLEHRRMVGLSLALIEQFEALKLERGLVDMNDLERGALALLADAELAGWVQQRLDAQVRHLLIDEFQDTSPLQWHALYGWLAGYAGAGGGSSGRVPVSVFIVGDPKQSIYRFRRAEPRVFAAARDFVREALDGAVLACDHTRRNAPPVLAAVNAVFEQASLAQQYSGFRPHTTESAQPTTLDGVFHLDAPAQPEAAEEAGGVDPDRWRPSLSEARHEPELQRRAAEAERLTREILRLLREDGLQPGEIFVLARKREPLRVLAQALKAAGVPHAAPEEQALLDAPDVRDLLALLDALASPGHNLSLAHALRSPLLGADEADLLQLARLAGSADWLDAQPQEPGQRLAWWAVLQTTDEALSPALQRARLLLERWERLGRERSPHDLIDAIVDEGDLLARLASAVPGSERRSRLHAVHALLALALDLDGGRYATLYGFVRALKSRALKLAWPAEPQAVQLLTVHGAKGLEARVVFMIDAEAAPARAETATLAIDWPVDRPSPRRVAFLASESKAPPALQALLDEEKQQRQREELNALYVAMTRARSRLVLSRTIGARAPTQPTWWSRLQALAQPLARPLQPAEEVAAIDPVAPAAVAPLLLKELPRWQPPPSRRIEAPASREAEDEAQARLGEAMHRVLEWASGPRQGQPVERLTAASAQMYALDAKQRERLQRSIAAILGSEACAPFFDPARLAWAGNEVALNWEGQDMRLDRLVCRHAEEAGAAPTWWVLDYKLHGAPEQNAEYLAQLRRYRGAVQQLQPGEPVRAALITAQGRLIDCTDRL